MGKLFSPLSVQDAIAKCLTDCQINVRIDVSQRSNFILDALNSRSGFTASAAEMVYLGEDASEDGVVVRTAPLSPHNTPSSSIQSEM